MSKNVQKLWLRRVVSWIIILATLVAVPSCTRPYYRRQADREVNCIIDTRRWRSARRRAQFRIDVDPKSRMFDPNSPDCPPMPPDDPISHQVDGVR